MNLVALFLRYSGSIIHSGVVSSLNEGEGDTAPSFCLLK